MIIKKVNKDRNFIEKNIDPKLIDEHTLLRNENWPWGREEVCVLLITETAKRDIFGFIGWNDRGCFRNRVEQGGLMAGRYYRDTVTGQRFAAVMRAFPMENVEGTPAFWDAKAEDWKQAGWELSCHNREYDDDLVSIGWFHTHPNGLDTFFSGTDRSTQSTVFNNPYNFGIVLNPHRLSWKGYRAEEAVDACCQIIDTDDIELFLRSEASAEEKPEEKPEEKSADKPEEKPEDKPEEKPEERIAEKPAEAACKACGYHARNTVADRVRLRREFRSRELFNLKNAKKHRGH